jgi:hypothetical protein
VFEVHLEARKHDFQEAGHDTSGAGSVNFQEPSLLFNLAPESPNPGSSSL